MLYASELAACNAVSVDWVKLCRAKPCAVPNRCERGCCRGPWRAVLAVTPHRSCSSLEGSGGDKANGGDSGGRQEEVVRIRDGRKGVSGRGVTESETERFSPLTSPALKERSAVLLKEAGRRPNNQGCMYLRYFEVYIQTTGDLARG